MLLIDLCRPKLNGVYFYLHTFLYSFSSRFLLLRLMQYCSYMSSIPLTIRKHTANIPRIIAPLQSVHASWLAIMIATNRDIITFLSISLTSFLIFCVNSNLWIVKRFTFCIKSCKQFHCVFCLMFCHFRHTITLLSFVVSIGKKYVTYSFNNFSILTLRIFDFSYFHINLFKSCYFHWFF